MRRGFWFFRAIKFVIFVFLFLLIGGFITMSLWNWLVPELFNGPVITFWQTIGLLILSKILFGGFGRGGWKRDRFRDRYKDKCRGWKEKMEEKMKGMSEEEKQTFKKRFTVTID
jgi:hypothetical protein